MFFLQFPPFALGQFHSFSAEKLHASPYLMSVYLGDSECFIPFRNFHALFLPVLSLFLFSDTTFWSEFVSWSVSELVTWISDGSGVTSVAWGVISGSGACSVINSCWSPIKSTKSACPSKSKNGPKWNIYYKLSFIINVISMYLQGSCGSERADCQKLWLSRRECRRKWKISRGKSSCRQLISSFVWMTSLLQIWRHHLYLGS